MSDFEKQLAAIAQKFKQLSAKKQAVNETFIDAECPVKIGDEVEINGYSHEGKKMLVRQIVVKENFTKGTHYFRATGPVLIADGSPGLQAGEWFSNR